LQQAKEHERKLHRGQRYSAAASPHSSHGIESWFSAATTGAGVLPLAVCEVDSIMVVFLRFNGKKKEESSLD